jgi:hypothetical protein
MSEARIMDEYRKAGATDLDSDHFVKLSIPNEYFFMACCDCGLAHKIHVSGQKEITIRFERLDDGIPLDEIEEDLVAVVDLPASGVVRGGRDE